MKMKALLLVLLPMIVSNFLWATSQIPEKMDYEGVSFDMYSTPLDSFFAGSITLPRIFREKPSPTSCHRGYIGSWRIDSGKLYLLSLALGYQQDKQVPLGKLVPQWKAPVLASWFSGTLRLGKGELVMGGVGFSETRSEEVLLEIVEGQVAKVKTKTNEKK